MNTSLLKNHVKAGSVGRSQTKLNEVLAEHFSCKIDPIKVETLQTSKKRIYTVSYLFVLSTVSKEKTQ